MNKIQHEIQQQHYINTFDLISLFESISTITETQENIRMFAVQSHTLCVREMLQKHISSSTTH